MTHPIWLRLAKPAARALDRAFVAGLLRPPRRSRSRVEALSLEERLAGLGRVAEFYAAREASLFPTPPAIAPHERLVRTLTDGGEAVDLTWPSGFVPLWGDAVAAGFARETPNQTAHARWLRHPGDGRTCLVLIHGYLGGSYGWEERMWPVRDLYERGYDVVLTVLPLHGPRRSPRRGLKPPAFPSADPRFTVEGFRQVVFEHRALIDFLLASGLGRVGVMGMSLGGYSAALLATIEGAARRLSLVVPYVPLASMSWQAERTGRLVGDPEQRSAQQRALDRAYRPVSPLARVPQLSLDQMVVIAGQSDRVTGLRHGRALAEHFAAPLVIFPGGHLLQLGQRRAILEALERTGAAPAG